MKTFDNTKRKVCSICAAVCDSRVRFELSLHIHNLGNNVADVLLDVPQSYSRLVACGKEEVACDLSDCLVSFHVSNPLFQKRCEEEKVKLKQTLLCVHICVCIKHFLLRPSPARRCVWCCLCSHIIKRDKRLFEMSGRKVLDLISKKALTRLKAPRKKTVRYD